MPKGSVVPECAATGRKACEQACDDNDGHACIAAARAHFNERDLEAMKDYEQRACRLGVAEGCFDYANNFPDGDPETLATVIEYTEKACDPRHAEGCVRLGVDIMHAAARGDGAREPREALAAFDASCELELSDGLRRMFDGGRHTRSRTGGDAEP